MRRLRLTHDPRSKISFGALCAAGPRADANINGGNDARYPALPTIVVAMRRGMSEKNLTTD